MNCPICNKPLYLYFFGCDNPRKHLRIARKQAYLKLKASLEFLVYSIKIYFLRRYFEKQVLKAYGVKKKDLK